MVGTSLCVPPKNYNQGQNYLISLQWKAKIGNVRYTGLTNKSVILNKTDNA